MVEKLEPVWHCAQLVKLPGLGCEKVTVLEVIEVPLVQPVSVTIVGTPAAPSQFGAVAEPVPGQVWQDEQSCDPDALVYEE